MANPARAHPARFHLPAGIARFPRGVRQPLSHRRHREEVTALAKDELSVEDFQDWWKDPRGEWFWEAVKALLDDRQVDVGQMVTMEKFSQASMSQGAVETLQHVIRLPNEIVEEKKGEAYPHSLWKRLQLTVGY